MYKLKLALIVPSSLTYTSMLRRFFSSSFSSNSTRMMSDEGHHIDNKGNEVKYIEKNILERGL